MSEDGTGLRRCERYRRDGSPCPNRTVHLDGWCRQPDCDGFLRPAPQHAPESIGAPSGTRAHLRRTGAAVAELDSDEAFSVDMTRRAIESFRFHHGGTDAAAETELRCMLEDFVRLSARQETPTGFIRLSRSGYTLILSPQADAVTGYVTVHRERTWSQYRAGVPSRFGTARRRRKQAEPVPAPDVAVGQRIAARVSSIVNFGVFVAVGNCDGLLHKSALPLGEGQRPRDLFEIGQELQVLVVDVDASSGRVCLRLDAGPGTAGVADRH